MNNTDNLDTDKILKEHRAFFERGQTHNVNFRIEQLKNLKCALKEHESSFMYALQKDLGKSQHESYLTEIGIVYHNINFVIKRLKKWAKPKRTKTPLYALPSKSYIISEPYGTVLIISPFNYPVQLALEPLIGAISGGNCVVLKPSENTPNVTKVLSEMIGKTFDKDYIRVIKGDRNITGQLINAPFDYLFFTGSVPVGKIIMEAAAKNLVPVTLELGGKSPAIVEITADIALAARKIAWGRCINVGQTCIAPDYILVDKRKKQEFIDRLKITLAEFYGESIQQSRDYGRIVNEKQFDRLADIIVKEEESIIHGGNLDRHDLFISPTIIDADWNSPSMEDELFGPIFPILTYDNLDEALREVCKRPKPLALYLFTKDKGIVKQITERVPFGGGCINDTIMHVTNPYLPFGGVGNSGIGSYHGKYSFDLFTHKKSVMKNMLFEMKLAYPPYGNKIKLIKKFLK